MGPFVGITCPYTDISTTTWIQTNTIALYVISYSVTMEVSEEI